MRYLSILGVTGSIGRQTIDVVKEHPDEFNIVSMSAGNNMSGLEEVLASCKPELVCVKEQTDALRMARRYPSIRFVSGTEGLLAVSTHPKVDTVVNALVGFVGLRPTLAAIKAHKTIALANKETLVVAGKLVTEACKKEQVTLLPIDSEHSAILQCLRGNDRTEIRRLWITASGGSFREKSRAELNNVTKAQALSHPNWQMGQKITIDSATMMNKGFEVIEAHWLFDIPLDDIEVLMHKESVIHSMIEYQDGAIMAQLGSPDMRIPIQYALSYPNRYASTVNKPLDLNSLSSLHFAPADFKRYPLLRLAYQVGRMQGNLPAIMNAANEVAVQLFLQDRISFLQIETLVMEACSKLPYDPEVTLANLEKYDKMAREFVLDKENA